VSWLQNEVLQQTILPKGLCKGCRQPAGRPTQLEAQLGMATKGSQLPTRPRKAGPSSGGVDTVNAVIASPDSSEEEEEGGERQRLKH
jgi:hypothetical protein